MFHQKKQKSRKNGEEELDREWKFVLILKLDVSGLDMVNRLDGSSFSVAHPWANSFIQKKYFEFSYIHNTTHWKFEKLLFWLKVKLR